MKLFQKYDLSGTELSSRVVMAPLTRRRCDRAHVPVDFMATYYGQRSDAALIIAEGASPSPNGAGYANMPGLYNNEQLEGWAKVTKEVHKKNGKIFLQVMHTGRVSHQNNLDNGGVVMAPSEIRQDGEVSTYDYGKQPYSLPKEMTYEDIKFTIKEYAACAKLAIQAGFDGIEIHSAHGYLPNQFLNKSSNKRSDDYGGTLDNRLKFLLEVIEHSVKEIGSDKVGLRISPFSYADTEEDEADMINLYHKLVDKLNPLKLAYLHLSHMGEPVPQKFKLWKDIRERYKGTLIVCGDFTKESAEQALDKNEADLIAFGRDFIANPDLVDRFRHNWPLEARDRTNWYTNGSEGLIDFPNYLEG